MSALIRLLQSLLPSMESQQERDEAYLAGSVDIYDLERRMLSIDLRARAGATALAAGLYPR